MYDLNNLNRTNITSPMVHEKNVTTLGYQTEGVWIYTGGEDGKYSLIIRLKQFCSRYGENLGY